MTRIGWILVAILWSLIVVAASDCGQQGGPKTGLDPGRPVSTPIGSSTPLPDDSTDSVPIGDPTDYFPNLPGSFWEFGDYWIEIPDTTFVRSDGRPVQLFRYRRWGSSASLSYYFRKEATEVRFFSSLNAEADTGWIELKLPLRVGETWFYWRAVQEWTVTVPAGQFEHTVKVEWFGGTAFEGDSRYYRWYAPGVGIVIDKLVGLPEQALQAYGEIKR